VTAPPAFAGLPPAYQDLIHRAEEQHALTITPLQSLGGGWSGARLFLVSVAASGQPAPEHLILKLDRKHEHARAGETERHARALALSPPDFAARNLPRLAHPSVEHEGLVAIFYAIAGQSLRSIRPLGQHEQQAEIEALFAETYRQLLEAWNPAPEFRPAMPPTAVLAAWLGFRLQAGNHIESFVRDCLNLPPALPGFLVDGTVYPNPLAYAQSAAAWGGARPLDVPLGLLHGDLNTGNILARMAPGGAVEEFYLIDFALFKPSLPLLFDLRYLEMSYLLLRRGQAAPAQLAALVAELAAGPGDPSRAPSHLAGLYGVLAAARRAFGRWVTARHPSLTDDLWSLYWLAGTAAGLVYCHKPGLDDASRLLGLLYGAANLQCALAHLGLPPPIEARHLLAAEQAPRAASVALPRSPLHNLPAAPTPIVGREAEVALLRERLTRPDVRLVTLTGPGGTGKTRLALHMAAALLEAYPDGVFFVSLAEVRDPARVVTEIAHALGLREGNNQPVAESLAAHLRDLAPLLVLDNLEQVVAAAEDLARLLAAAPRLTLLVTSRVALRLRGEHELPVPPLALPQAETTADPAEALRFEAVRLFVARAQAASPAFALTDQNAADVARICRRLDGLPLAIELAAARVKLLPPAAILARLDHSLALLTGGARDLPARHQTLRAALDWSYDLLSAAEQTLFARLGVFVGGFTLAASETVCGGGDDLDVLTGLSALLDSSLIQSAPGPVGGEPRYRMLETIREYALERLAAAGEAEALRRAHARYFITQVSDVGGLNLFMADATRLLDHMEAEHDNIRATLEWCLAEPEGRPALPDLVLWLNWFWYRRGYVAEGRRISHRILQALTGRSPARAAALQNHGLLLMWQGELTAALLSMREAVEMWLALEDERGLHFALMNLGVVLINMGRDEEAHPALSAARDIFHTSGLFVLEAVTLVHLGNVSLGLGRPDEAEGWLRQALEMARGMDEPWTISFALNNLGEVARVRGDYAAARAFYAESEALLRSTGDHGDLARLIHNLGRTDLHAGDLAGAEARFAESLALFRRLNNKRGLAECLAAFAALRAQQGLAERAAELLAAGHAMLTTWGAAWWPADRVEIDRTRAALLAALEPEAFESAWARGQALSPEAALRLAHGRDA
jgi:predicted ATPase